jgi:hypothetical protein
MFQTTINRRLHGAKCNQVVVWRFLDVFKSVTNLKKIYLWLHAEKNIPLSANTCCLE